MTFWTAPLTYPGPVPDTSVLLTPNGVRPLDLSGPRARDRAVLDGLLEGRRAVVAVGSNASPDVVRRKLTAAAADPTLPLIKAGVANLFLALSAHVSRPGFVPAAPARVPGLTSRVTVSWFDAEQLAAIDATEPSYHRLRLEAADHPVVIDGLGTTLPEADVYASTRGVLRDGAVPRALGSQAELARWLAGHGLTPWRDHDAASASRLLARSPDLRARAGEQFRAAGLVVADGLAHPPRGRGPAGPGGPGGPAG